MRTRVFAAAVLVLIAAACGPRQEYQPTKASPVTTLPVAEGGDSRITVERIAVIADSLAYDDKRGVYVIRDKQTGREYIGVSGIGITEVGSHASGKSRISDER